MTYYQITADNILIHDSRNPNLRVHNATLNLHAGEAGSGFFRMTPDHPNYNSIRKLVTEITFWQDGEWLWSGRVLNDETLMDLTKRFEVEGELAYFNDSVARPYRWVGQPMVGLVSKWVNEHNAQVQTPNKQFTLGIVEIPEDLPEEDALLHRSSGLYVPMWQEMREKLPESNIGGYLRTRHGAGGVRYLDYIQDYGNVNDQVIEFGKNLVSLDKFIKGQDLVTAVIPLGSKISDESDERITISEINGGLDYVFDQDAVDEYGWIFKHVTHDGVTNLEALRAHGYRDLTSLAVLNVTLKLQGVDLHLLDVNVEKIKLGDQIRVISKPHGVDEYMMVMDLHIDLTDPSQNTIELGSEVPRLTDQVSYTAFNRRIDEVLSNYVTNEANVAHINDVITEVTAEYTSMINQTSEAIALAVSEEYATKTELGEETVAREASIELLADSTTLRFAEASTDLQELQGVVDEDREARETWIRFDIDGMELGRLDSEFTAELDNTQLAFLQNGQPIAYISNNKLYITDAEIRNNLALGTPDTGYFDFIPRANGNLSFKFRS